MIDGTRRWLRRNRSRFAVGIGVLGVGYLAGQYVVSKITEARERMAIDRTAKEKCVFDLSIEAIIDLYQLTTKIPAKPRRLHLYSIGSPPHCDRKCS